MRSGVPRAGKRVRDCSCSTVRSLTRGSSYTTVTYIEDIGQSHAGSLDVSSVFLSPCRPSLVDSVGFLVVFLTLLGPTVVCSPLLWGFVHMNKGS